MTRERPFHPTTPSPGSMKNNERACWWQRHETLYKSDLWLLLGSAMTVLGFSFVPWVVYRGEAFPGTPALSGLMLALARVADLSPYYPHSTQHYFSLLWLVPVAGLLAGLFGSMDLAGRRSRWLWNWSLLTALASVLLVLITFSLTLADARSSTSLEGSFYLIDIPWWEMLVTLLGLLVICFALMKRRRALPSLSLPTRRAFLANLAGPTARRQEGRDCCWT